MYWWQIRVDFRPVVVLGFLICSTIWTIHFLFYPMDEFSFYQKAWIIMMSMPMILTISTAIAFVCSSFLAIVEALYKWRYKDMVWFETKDERGYQYHLLVLLFHTVLWVVLMILVNMLVRGVDNRYLCQRIVDSKWFWFLLGWSENFYTKQFRLLPIYIVALAVDFLVFHQMIKINRAWAWSWAILVSLLLFNLCLFVVVQIAAVVW